MSTPISTLPIFDPEDPKLTAYALGELADPAERAEIERLLQYSPEARLVMKDIQEITKDLAAEYDQERRASATAVAEPPPANVVDLATHVPPRRTSWTRPLLAIAAALLVVGLVMGLALPVVLSVQKDSKKSAARLKEYNEAVAAAANAPEQPAQGPVQPQAQIVLENPAPVQLKLENGRKLNDSKDSELLGGNPSAETLAQAAPVDAVTAGGSTVMQPSTPALALNKPSAGEPELADIQDQLNRGLAEIDTPGVREALDSTANPVAAPAAKPFPGEGNETLYPETRSRLAENELNKLAREHEKLDVVRSGDLTSIPPAAKSTAHAAASARILGHRIEFAKALSTTTVRRDAIVSTNKSALPPVPTVPGTGTQAVQPTMMEGMTAGTATGMGSSGGGGGMATPARAKKAGAPVDASAAVSKLAQFGGPQVVTATPQKPRVFRGETDFYRTEAGSKSERVVDDLARNTVDKDRLEGRYGFAEKGDVEAVPQNEVVGATATRTGGSGKPLTTDDLAKAKLSITVNSAAPEITLYNTPRKAMLAVDAKTVTDNRLITRSVIPPNDFNTATYDHLVENAFLGAKENPLSTFSIDVDTASYANVRRFIDGGNLPPPDAVRLEELINYFPYDYAPPAADSDKPFAVHLEAAACPWEPEHRLVRIGIKGKEIAQDKRPASNLVFLLDVSGSMQPPERLPLVKQAMRLLTEQLTESDHIAIVTYAGNSGLVLPSTSGDHKDAILSALDNLNAGGSTNGASGIALAYKVAQEAFIKGGTNRVILATDGDFNVGVTNQGELVRLIQEKAKSGVFLSALGVGTDNFKDSTMQKLADKGNGNYNYIDRLEEARKVLVEQMSGTLLTIAKDVKIQVEFNPALVGSYRLIGYEKRALKKEDFNNDQIDAGEIGAGHSITALYEVVPVGQSTPGETPAVDTLKYAADGSAVAAAERAKKDEAVAPGIKSAPTGSGEMLTVKLRHKAPDAEKSERTYEVPLVDTGAPGDFAKASPEFKFAAAVATFGLTLRDSPYKGGATFGAAAELAQEGKGNDPKGYRSEFINLLRRAQAIKDAR